jgi:hypothetical protein
VLGGGDRAVNFNVAILFVNGAHRQGALRFFAHRFVQRHCRGWVNAVSVIAFLVCLGHDTYAAIQTEEKALRIQSGDGVGFTPMEATSIGLSGSAQMDVDSATLVNSGLAAGDFDGDGRVDLFVCDYNGNSRLYRNEGGWRFKDVTLASGLEFKHSQCVGAVFADVDGDGDLDLLAFTLSSGEWLFLNDGEGRFSPGSKLDRTDNEADGGAVTAAVADVDGDGDLDFYLARYRSSLVRDAMLPSRLQRFTNEQIGRYREGLPLDPEFERFFRLEVLRKNGAVRARALERGVCDELYINDGKGGFRIADSRSRFKPESESSELALEGFGLCAQFRDVDGDGDPDLYVCNDFFSKDRFWLNDGAGVFTEVSGQVLRRTPFYSMGVDFADIDRDGHLDFFAVDMLSRRHDRRKIQMGDMQTTEVQIGEILNRPQIMQNTLFLNRGDNTFAEIAQFAGIKASEWSWSAGFMDVDLDGYEDLLVTTGMSRDYMDSDIKAKVEKMTFASDREFFESRKLFPPLPTSNFVFRNQGDLRFENKSREWGLGREAVSGGVALADFDDDGDLDVAINNMDGAPEIYRNDAGAARVAVRLRGRAPNTQAIGAKIALEGGLGHQFREVIAGGRYASGSDTLQVFAAGQSESRLRLIVTWRDGRQTTVEDVKVNHVYEVSELDSQPVAAIVQSESGPWFEDVSGRIGHRHHEDPYDDFARQPLLPNRLSQSGPGVGWIDLEGDGDQDLLIGAGAGGRMSAYVNDGRGNFTANHAPQIPVDQSGLAAWSKGRSLVGISNYETGSSEHVSAQVFELSDGKEWSFGQGVKGAASATGPLATGDIDGDGDLDLFVGGRVIPGRYPEASTSRVFLNQSGKLRIDPTNEKLLKNIGLVSGAAMGDLDGDGDLDLALACEWGPVRILRNEEGVFRDATKASGMNARNGWWNGVTLGDFDGDGRLDIAASNWGRNSKYEHSYSVLKPLRIYHHDFDDDGRYDVVEAHFDKHMNCLVPERGFSCSSRAMPFIRTGVPSFRAFATSALENIYGANFQQARVVKADTLAHTVFLNRGEKFEAKELPTWAQLAPGFGINAGDLDGDGNEDLFLAQNFFAVQTETPRNDGGRGLLLRGDGAGNFVAIKGQQSGIKIYGEQRGSALGDFDGDGRVDVVVAQNGAETKLFRNARARPGLRVSLSGPPGNERGIGAILRLEYADGTFGPARALLGGSGHMSQESLETVMALPKEPKSLRIAWPGGKETVVKISKDARQLTAGFPE